jgi:L-rhamnose isomerase/sugar isomerase
LRAHIAAAGLGAGAVSPNLFQDPDYKLGSITNPDARVRSKAVEHLIECVGIARELGSTALSLWFADGTNYPGQDSLSMRRCRLIDSLRETYAELPPGLELLLEYKPFEPAFYATDLADWGSALLVCQQLGPEARVLVDLGHHAQGTNVEQIVTILAGDNRLGGFHFNNRKYADDDLIVGSVNPFELFLIFCELIASGGPLPRLTIDQAHNVEAKLEAMVLSVVNLQEAHAKALLVDRERLAAMQRSGDVLGGHEVLLDAYRIDVSPLCAKVRSSLGAPEDPIGALRSSGYVSRAVAERGGEDVVAGGWGR